ncbi:hypothetical protein GQ53DRAFT_696167 [Thozetella sp. PMI_491]|nr:hypothetical protein GQ53DRAFT_696167 [Thozetella sp. PMI_491]
MAENIVVYHNDLTDSDNWAAARFLHQAAVNSAATRIIWVIEPRRVSLGHYVTTQRKNACLRLLEKHFPSRGSPLKVFLRGALQETDLDALGDLSEDERDLLSLAMKIPYGPREDDILHGRLLALDFLNCLASWSTSPVEVLLDVDALERIQSPANLKVHFHEELVARSNEEVENYYGIMNKRHVQRIQQSRSWYRRCIETVEATTKPKGHSLRNLSLGSLCDTIKTARRALFLGGASLGLLQRLIQKGAAAKMHCYLQAGAFDQSMLIFQNQFNIGLDPDAASFVISRFDQFASFTLVPSDTARRVKYSLAGLSSTGGPLLRKRFLGYNCRIEPERISADEDSLDDLLAKSYTMSDLTAFLCVFNAGYKAQSTLGHAQLVNDNGVFGLRRQESGIPIRELTEDLVLSESQIRDLLAKFAVD